MTKVIRVRQSNAAAALAALEGSRLVAAHLSLHGGCLDRECCVQHSGFIGGERAVGIALREGMSGRAAHRALVAAGVVK